MSDELLIIAEGLTKQFDAKSTPAIDNLNARIGRSRVTGLVGPDAAGKTTLLRLFAGLLLPNDGKLTVCSADPIRELASCGAPPTSMRPSAAPKSCCYLRASCFIPGRRMT